MSYSLVRNPPIFVLAAMLIAVSGCGGASRKTSSSHKKKVSHAKVSHNGGKKGVGGSVAQTTRAVTMKRKGSWGVTSQKVKDVAPFVSRGAKENNIPEDLIFGIIWVESRFNREAVSPVGARGLMQLMPRTADYLAECIGWTGRHRSFDPEFNVAAGSYYIARLVKQFDGDEDLALAAYNAGPTKIRRWMKGSGLPRVSIEYHTMVQTARGFFGGTRSSKPGGRMVVPTDDDLDRLGLAILIAGLSDKQFGLERTDDANPFD
jgi:hypothetical protein